MTPALLDSEARRAPALANLRCKFNSLNADTTAKPGYVITADTPEWAKKRKVHGTKAAGVCYEKRVGKYLSLLCSKHNWELWDHQWFAYINENEIRYFQPDFVISRPNECGIVVEVKLTYVDATAQLQKYVEYLKLWEEEGENINFSCFPVTVTYNLTPNTPSIITEFSEVVHGAVLHLRV